MPADLGQALEALQCSATSRLWKLIQPGLRQCSKAAP
jgi:hypothetical protein